MDKYLAILIIIFTLVSCSKTNDTEPDNSVIQKGGLFIINEGNYSIGNSSLSYYYPTTGEVQNSLFYRANNVPLGDVAQSMTIYKDQAYFVINNSGLIYVTDNSTLEFKGKINDLVSPRELLIINDDKAYVSDLYNTSIAIVNPTTYTKTGSIEVGKSTDCLIKSENFVFAANWSSYNQEGKNNTVMVINANSNELIDSIVVGIEPNSMKTDKYGNLWVLCSGGFLNDELPTLWKINSVDLTIKQTYTFNDISGNPLSMCINNNGDSLFFLNGDVYRMSITDTNLPETGFISSDDKNFYTMEIDPHTSELYISNVLDYNQEGIIYRYTPSGVLVSTIESGIIPGCLYFNY
jgi:uncharacterized protein DUF5074